ncbi:MAG TPA: hypothetical protein VLU73_14145 [Methylococcaceae bacterium]|jgi:hypothetical protein|nr:hypothetical protein [Methylococcaceae bacterium]
MAIFTIKVSQKVRLERDFEVEADSEEDAIEEAKNAFGELEWDDYDENPDLDEEVEAEVIEEDEACDPISLTVEYDE